MAEQKSKAWQALKIILILLVVSFFAALFLSAAIGTDFEERDGNVAIIELTGPIVSQDQDVLFTDITSADEIRKLIRRAERDDDIRAIVFEINSPGGSAVASDEIARAIKGTNKTTVAWIREIGTSGAYWVASSTDHIVANRMSITGSIGVIASYLQFGGFLEDHNVTYERLVSGSMKDIGSPFKGLTPQERYTFQQSLDRIHDFFIEEVAQNRNLDKRDVERIATGAFYIGEEAYDLGLVDELGSQEEVKAYLEEQLGGEVNFARYKSDRGFLGALTGAFSGQSFYIGRGIGSELASRAQENPVISIRT